MYNLIERKKTLNNNHTSTNFRYKLFFVSIVPPHYTDSLNMFTPDLWQNNAKLPNKYFIKQSYLILAWFYYLKTISSKTKNATNDNQVNSKYQRVSFVILPVKHTHYTLIKAPMAHKKNSKEQFLFKFYFIAASFHGSTDTNWIVPSCDSAIVALHLIQRFLPLFSTNLLFLKSITVSFTYSDYLFFNYYNFIKTTKSS